MQQIIAGKIKLYREECDKCGEFNLSGSRIFDCSCGNRYREREINYRRILAIRNKRGYISQKFKEELMMKQNYRCYWCGREFFTYVYKDGKPLKLIMHVDHVNPAAYRLDDNVDNLVGSCQLCNLFKSSKMFDDKEDCKNFITDRWYEYKRKGLIIETSI